MEISQHLSLYDLLCMFVIGYLILYPFFMCQSLCTSEYIIYFILCYLIGIVYHKMIEYMTSSLKNIPWMWEKGRKEVEKQYLKKTGAIELDKKVDYYDAYYFLIRTNCLNVIPVLEVQVAFIRNVYPLLIIYVCLLSTDCIFFVYDRCNLMAFLSILVVTLPFIWYKLQLKVYQLVWEGYYYINNLKIHENEKDHN